MTIQIYNTMTHKKEIFEPQNPPNVLWYNCGPTVYDYFHIGNARNFIIADTIRRYLIFRGYKVRFIQNFTDIDDKIIKKAQKEKISARAVARKYTDIYFQQADMLNIMRADIYPKATETISDIIALVEKLIIKGHAYVLDGDVYFRISSFSKYGKLSGKNIDELIEGARVEVDSRKESPLDFALWKSAKDGEPSWESPWGFGRPGWHIECSAMSITHLGESIDIHSGGNDLIFPHHENEIAQSECATGKTFVKYWLHNGFLNINNQKMSKSLGNFFTVNDILQKFDPGTIRYFLISAHYRHPLDFAEENINEAKNALNRIKSTIETAEQLLDKCNTFTSPSQSDIDKKVYFQNKFTDSMDDDFNTAQALSVIFEIISEINDKRIMLNQTDDDVNKLKIYSTLTMLISLTKQILEILGLGNILTQGQRLSSNSSGSDEMIEKLLQLLISLRETARKEKVYSISDKIRSGLSELEIILEDHPQGTIWKRK